MVKFHLLRNQLGHDMFLELLLLLLLLVVVLASENLGSSSPYAFKAGMTIRI